MMKRFMSVVLVAVMMFGIVTMAPIRSQAASEMKASEKLTDLIKTMEGFTAVPVWDYNQWTVGFGTRCPDEHLERYKAEGIPLDEAHALFLEHLVYFENEVNKFISRNNLTLSQHQFDALVSMTYNLGSAFLYNSNNLATKAILSGAEGNELIFAFTVSCTAGGEFLPGLMRRRLMESVMYLQGVYDQYPADNYCYVLYDPNGGKRDVYAQGYDCNLTAVPMSVPTYEGHTFLGWYTQPVGGVRVTSLDQSMDGMTLYAHWHKGSTDTDMPVEPVNGVRVTVTGNSVNVRSGPGMDYSIVGGVVRGDVLVITGVCEVEGTLWGQFADGWICLDYTNYEEVISGGADDDDDSSDDHTHELPLGATVIAESGITIYNGPHTSYPKRGTLAKGDEILILEFMTFMGQEWARFSEGWVQVNQKLLLHDDGKLVHPFKAIVTYASVYIRSGPGTNYNFVDIVAKNTELTILAVKIVDDISWGRTEKGWIYLNGYTDYDPAKLPSYQNHSYGAWYVFQASTCAAQGEERRDCKMCDHYESRSLPLGNHKMGSWYDVKTATCVTPGQQQRDCQNCNHSETRQTGLGDHDFGPWYETKAPTDSKPGEARRDCQNCSYYETKVVEPCSHTFGNWYVSVTPTCTEPGQQRRDCSKCGHFETRTIAAKGHSLGNWKVHKAATCTTDGEQRRNCANCSYYESRVVKATGHSFGSWYVYKEATGQNPGEERRDCQNCDHYESKEIPATGVETITKTYATMTNRNYASLNIRTGAGYTYNIVGKLYYGDRVEILEQKTVSGNVWGRIQSGWVQITGFMTLEKVEEDVPPVESAKIYATMTNGNYASLNIRSGAGYNYSVVGKIYYGDRVEILEQKTVDGNVWGRIQSGWILITGFMTMESEETPVPPVESTKIYATMTNRNYASLNIRSGAGYGFGVVGKLYYGDRVEILEQKTVDGNVWGRIQSGWILITGFMTLEQTEEPAPTKLYGTVTNRNFASLNIRSGAGYNYSVVGKVYYGDRVEILEQKTVSGIVWGRIAQGWIQITDFITLENGN